MLKDAAYDGISVRFLNLSVRGDLCCQLITFANSLDPDQDRQNGSESKAFEPLIVFLKELFLKKKFSRTTKSWRITQILALYTFQCLVQFEKVHYCMTDAQMKAVRVFVSQQG